MPKLTTSDGVNIYFKDWGEGQPVVFSHGWPLTADVSDGTMQFVADHGLRGIAHDRRGGGRSDQPWEGNDLDHYADDLAAVIESLDLHDVVFVGRWTGGGEVTRYIGRHGTSQVAKVVLLGAIPPLMLGTSDKTPEGLPITPFDEIRKGLVSDRSQYYRDLAIPFYGANREGSTVSEGAREALLRYVDERSGMKGAYDCVRAFSETDLTEDLEDRRPHAHPARRRRPDRPDPGRCPEVLQDRPGQHAEDLSGGAPRTERRAEQEFNKDLLNFLTT